MSANGKATEPSMDDILASIRRIIAEEPKPGAAPAVRSAESAARSADAVPMRPLADAPAAPSIVASPTPSSTMPLPPAKPTTAWGSLGATSPAAPSVVPSAPLAPPVPAGTVARPSSTASFGDDLASLIGAVRASANIAGVPAASPAAGAPPPPSAPPPAMEAMAPRPITLAPAPVPAPAASPIAAEARARGIEAAMFGAAAPKQAESKQAETLAAPAAAGASPVPLVGSSDLDAVSPVEPATAEPVKPAPVLAPATAAPVEAVASARPASLVSAPAPAPTAASTATAGKVAVARTMEDTVAEMLRPMLRDWLDENMPNIVEKAMKAELADREQRKTGQKPN